MKILIIICVSSVLVSFAADRRKTFLGLKKGLMMFAAILPALIGMLSLISLIMAALPPETVRSMLSGGGPAQFLLAMAIGSIALIPGFIAYPLAGILKANGATTPVISVFITTLMMVGVITLPMEAKYFGWKVAALRNALAFIGAVVVALIMGVILQ